MPKYHAQQAYTTLPQQHHHQYQLVTETGLNNTSSTTTAMIDCGGGTDASGDDENDSKTKFGYVTSAESTSIMSSSSSSVSTTPHNSSIKYIKSENGGSAGAGQVFQNTKISSHLLDHGYGATPQNVYTITTAKNVAAPQAPTTTTTKMGQVTSDGCITNYYKAVKRRLTMTSPSSQMSSPTPAKQLKHQQQPTTKVIAATPTPPNSANSKKRYSEGTRLEIFCLRFVNCLIYS